MNIIATLLRRLSDAADRLSRFLLVPLVMGFVGVVFVAVLSRYVFNEPVIQSIELTRLSFNWGCFLGAVVGVKRLAHVRFVFLIERLDTRQRQFLNLFVQILMAAFFVLMIEQGWHLFMKVKGTVFPALEWSQGLLYLSLPVAGAIMLVHAASALADDLLALADKGERP